MTIAIALAVGILIGAIITGIAKTNVNDIPCPHWDYDLKAGKVSMLETRVYMLEKENERLNYIYENLTRDRRLFHDYMACHCSICHKTFYGKSQKEHEVADMLKNITLTSEEIAKKLDIKIL